MLPATAMPIIPPVRPPRSLSNSLLISSSNHILAERSQTSSNFRSKQNRKIRGKGFLLGCELFSEIDKRENKQTFKLEEQQMVKGFMASDSLSAL